MKVLWDVHRLLHLFAMGLDGDHAHDGNESGLLVLLHMPGAEMRALWRRILAYAFQLGDLYRYLGIRPTQWPNAARLRLVARWRGRDSELAWPADF